MLVNLDGQITDSKKACMPVASEAFLFGFMVFETVRTYDKKVFRLEDHLARLFVSADIMNIKPKWTFKKVYAEVVRLLEKTKYKQAKIRIILSRKHLIITSEKLKEKPDAWYKKGIKMVSYLGARNTPRAKVLSDAFCHLAKLHAQNSGAYEALLVDPKKYYVRECAYANVFWVSEGELYTTNKNILYGITRDTVVELAESLSIPVHFEGVTLKSILQADEIFITQTTSGILPAVELDGHKIGNGKPGKVTKKLMKKFDQLVWSK